MIDTDLDLIPEPIEQQSKEKPVEVKTGDLDFAADKLFNALNLPKEIAYLKLLGLMNQHLFQYFI